MLLSRLMAATLACATLSAASTVTDNSNGVPKALLSRFTTGVNVTRWFCYLGPGDQDAHFAGYLGEADYKAFTNLGVKFVRLCISPDAIYKDGQPNEKLAKVDTALSQLFKRNLAVIWDLHDNGQLGLDKPAKDDSGLISFWTALARHYKGRYYSDLAFEIVNEPVFTEKPEVWYALQAKVVAAIRKEDPNRTIIVSPTYWSSIDTLQKMQVLPEKNLIYTFHCYDPFFFTHQGAEWVGEYPGKLKSVPFPSSPETVRQILPENDAKFAGALEDYGKKGYDAAYLHSRLKLAADWGDAHRVPVLLGEFGAYPKVSPPASRARWFDGMRAAITSLQLPNSIWGYDDGLGLGRSVQQNGSLWLDPVTLDHFYSKKPVQAPAPPHAQDGKPTRVVIWDGEAIDKGSSWVNPTSSTFARTQADAHSGKTSLEFKFHDKNVWLGCGFDWNDWKAGRDIGTDTSGMNNLNFWIKTNGLTGDLQLQLLCNGDVIDTPEHHAPKVSVAKYCPNFRDGNWHEVVIPLADMPYPQGYDPKVVTMIDFGFWTEGEANGFMRIDDLAFDNRPLPKPNFKD